MKAIQFKVIPIGWGTCRWLRYFWKDCLLTSMNGISLRDIPVPELPGPDWVLVKTRLGGICGSDIALAMQKQPPSSLLQAFSSMPFVVGHENVSVVESTGANVDDSWVGRRVLVEPTLSCVVRGTDPMCPRCEAGEFGACENFSAALGGSEGIPPGTSIGYNGRTGGSWGEYFVAHKSQLVPVDDSLSDEQAILVDPIACSLHSLLRADLSEARAVLVYGAGILGLGTIACLRALGYEGRIDVLDRHRFLKDIVTQQGGDGYLILPKSNRERFEEIASRTGSTIQRARFGNYMLSGGYDVIVDCVGTTGSVTEALKWTRARGQVVMLGTLQTGKVDLTPLWFRELSVIGTYGRQLEHYDGQMVNTYKIVHDWMVEGKINPDGLLTHTFRFSEYKKALKTAINKGQTRSIKVAFDFRD